MTMEHRPRGACTGKLVEVELPTYDKIVNRALQNLDLIAQEDRAVCQCD